MFVKKASKNVLECNHIHRVAKGRSFYFCSGRKKKWSAENNNSKKTDKTTFLSVSVCCSVIDSVWLCGLPQYIFNATTHSSNPTISPKRNEYSICLFSWWSNWSMKGINKYGIDILLKKYQTTCLLFDCCCFVDSWMYIHTFYGER